MDLSLQYIANDLVGIGLGSEFEWECVQGWEERTMGDEGSGSSLSWCKPIKWHHGTALPWVVERRNEAGPWRGSGNAAAVVVWLCAHGRAGISPACCMQRAVCVEGSCISESASLGLGLVCVPLLCVPHWVIKMVGARALKSGVLAMDEALCAVRVLRVGDL